MRFPPGPKPRYPFDFLLRFRRDILAFIVSIAREYGDLAYLRVGPVHLYMLNAPEEIKHVLVTHHKNFIKSRGLQFARRLLGEGLLTSEGEFHLRQRRLVQPAFHRQRIDAYGRTMAEYALRMNEQWYDGMETDISQEMMRLTLAIAGKTLFNTDVEREADEIGQALSTAMDLFVNFTNPLVRILEKLPLPETRRFEKAKERLDATIYRMINERRASGKDQGDLLSMLLLAQDVEGDGTGMTDEQVRDEALTLLLAGHETTAVALTWTWYLLSQHPEVESKLHAELTEVLGGRPPVTKDLEHLRYTRQVLTEAMRLYPPAYTFGRMALHEYRIGEFTVPAHATISMCPYVVHRNSAFYTEPEKFLPERWTPEFEERRHKFAYIPFGGGPRVCIGEAFAWMEGVLVLATLAQHWQMRLAPNHVVALRPLITLRPKYGMKMILRRIAGK